LRSRRYAQSSRDHLASLASNRPPYKDSYVESAKVQLLANHRDQVATFTDEIRKLLVKLDDDKLLNGRVDVRGDDVDGEYEQGVEVDPVKYVRAVAGGQSAHARP
jgi:hypothetical protein